MKNIYIIIIAVIFLLTGNSCVNWLDIRPESEIVLEDYWQNESHVNQVLAACYKSLIEENSMKHILAWGELRSDNVVSGNNPPEPMTKILNFDINPANEYCEWGSMYTVINYCNTVLSYAPEVTKKDPNFTESKLHSVEAEAKAIRALAYFYLVRTFEEVPWIDTPSIDDVQDYNIPKSDEATILNHLVEDLITAIKFGRDEFDTLESTKGRFTKDGMRSLLADIYLWQGEYAKCIEYCETVINNPKFQLVEGEDVVTEVFSEGNSTESIFELQFDKDLQPNKVVNDFYGYSGNIQGQWAFPQVLYKGQYSPFRFRAGSSYESRDDLRKFDFLYTPSGNDISIIFKYAGYKREENTNGSNLYYYTTTTPNWIVYRLSDIMLMKAEALVQLETNNNEVMKMVNTVYLRSNIEDAEALIIDNYSSKFELEKLVLRERQRELMFEGKRWYDLMRMARRNDSPSPLLSYVTKKFSGSGSAEYTKMSVMDALYLPIHTKELESNAALEQNQFYETLGEN